MLSRDLAELYGVEHRALVQAVKRNQPRFPADFTFQLTAAEAASLRSQTVILDATGKGVGRGRHAKYPPLAFTEHGVAMLSSVLKSGRAVEVNIAIVRAFVQLRQWLISNKELARKLSDLEKKHDLRLNEHDKHLKVVFEAIQELLAPPSPPRKRMGFQPPKHKA